MGSLNHGLETADWKYGTILRDNLDGDVVILVSATPERIWTLVQVTDGGTVIVDRDEPFILLFYQERLA